MEVLFYDSHTAEEGATTEPDPLFKITQLRSSLTPKPMLWSATGDFHRKAVSSTEGNQASALY